MRHGLSHIEKTSKCKIFLHGHPVTVWDLPIEDDFIFILRDPIARFVSGFNDGRRLGLPRYRVPWTPIVARVFQHFATAQELALALRSNNARLRRMAHTGLRFVPHLKYPFSFWTGSTKSLEKNTKRIFFYSRVERLEDDLVHLCKTLGLPKLEMPTDTKLAHKGDPTNDTGLTGEAKDILRHYLRKDYDILNFCEDRLKIR
jgi:hypothetical protein